MGSAGTSEALVRVPGAVCAQSTCGAGSWRAGAWMQVEARSRPVEAGEGGRGDARGSRTEAQGRANPPRGKYWERASPEPQQQQQQQLVRGCRAGGGEVEASGGPWTGAGARGRGDAHGSRTEAQGRPTSPRGKYWQRASPEPQQQQRRARRPVAGAEREFRPAAAWGGAAAGVAASTTPGVVWRTAPPLNKRPTSCACGGSTRALSRAGPFVTSPCASRRHRVVVDALLGEAPEKGCVVGGALPSPGLGPPTTRQEAATLLRADPHTCGVHFSRVLLSHGESVNLEVVS